MFNFEVTVSMKNLTVSNKVRNAGIMILTLHLTPWTLDLGPQTRLPNGCCEPETVLGVLN